MPEFSMLPVDCPVTGRFGESTPPWSPSAPHRGVDFGCPTGTPVRAPAPGICSTFTNDGSFGIGVCIRHADGWYTLYAHLSKATVSPGNTVSAGQIIGYTGATGYVTGPHLHWQLCRTNTFPVDISYSDDPLKYVTDGDDMDEMTVRRIVREELQKVALDARLGTPDLALALGTIWRRIQKASVGARQMADAMDPNLMP